MSSFSSSEISLPPLKLPLFYQGFATLCFALALSGVIVYAQDLTGFYYHPRILALTHLVTLGWISANILGTLYMIAPMALRTHLNSRTPDAIALIFFTIGVTGMVAHFWRELPIGMAWSAACVYIGIVFTGTKFLRVLRRSKSPGFVKIHLNLAFVNFFAAGAWGLLLAIHKISGFLPTSSSPNVIAHAHLAAVGWATMMVFGIAYRLLPMFLPGEPVKGKLPVYSAILMEAGIAGLFLTTLLELKAVWIFSISIACGISLFLFSAIRTAVRRKPAPPPLPPRPDFSILHAPFAFSCLAACVILGLILLNVPPTEKTLRIALAYGALGLIGFLSQVIIGLKPKILSIFTWYYAFSHTGDNTKIPRPVDMPIRTFQAAVFLLWCAGLPSLIAGIVRSDAFMIRTGATLLLASLVIQTMHEVTILRLIWKK